MCGIVGYVGQKDILSVLIVGLERLSYRGYDSAGVAVVSDDEISIWKRTGKVHVLAKELETKNSDATIGIGHTRWATHGIPNEVNAHPHFDAKRRFSIVHNGIIENYLQLKSELIKEGFLFRSQTDSEVIVHLVDKYYNGSLIDAVKLAVQRLEGSFAFCVVSAFNSDCMLVARKNSPLIIGVGEKENYVSSDVNAIIPHTKKVIYLMIILLHKLALKILRFTILMGKSYLINYLMFIGILSDQRKMDMTFLCKKKFMNNHRLFVLS